MTVLDEQKDDLPVDRPIARAPTHPGELFREILYDHVGLTVSSAARRMQISRQSLHAVLSGEVGISADMALRFGRLTGGSPELYVQMQAQRDLWLAHQRLHDLLAEIEPAA